MTTSTPAGLIARIASGSVLGDGGYLLELERRGWVQAGPFTPEVVVTHPDAVLELHREFRHAGAEILQALTFYASEEKLRTVGLGGMTDEINRQAIRLARQAAAEAPIGSGSDVSPLVAGGLSLTWAYDPADRSSDGRVRRLLERQLDLQVAEGLDLIVCETFTFLGEALIAVRAAHETGLAVVATMGFDGGQHSAEGDSPADCARALRDAGADVVGANCLLDPSMTLPLVVEMAAAVPGTPVAAQPVAYRTDLEHPNFSGNPAFPLALEPIALTRGEMAAYATAARDAGVALIGSCCGSAPHHVAAMAEALGRTSHHARAWQSVPGRPMSAMEKHGLAS